MPDKIGTVKVRPSITLEPLCEHLVWGKLPASAPLSVGRTILIELIHSRSRPRNVLVGRVFSRDKMDCGEATDFVHKIHLVDERPLCLPYRRVAPTQ